MVCRKAQMSHQEINMRRNFPMDSGDLANVSVCWFFKPVGL